MSSRPDPSAPVEPAVPRGMELRYDCRVAELKSELAPLFVRLEADDAATSFIAASQAAPHGPVRHGLQRIARSFCSDFDANGLVGTYPMHLLSAPQWETLLGPQRGGHLLDIGAGDGGVTAPLATRFKAVSVTETSWAMAWRLRRRGYTCHASDVSHSEIPGAPYEAISLLNVLDRCAAPGSLVSSAIHGLSPNGLLILALALPYRPFFYSGSSTPRPLRPLPLNEQMSFEAAVNVLVMNVLAPLQLAPVAISRAPYLSWGDTRNGLYAIDDALVVCRKLAR